MAGQTITKPRGDKTQRYVFYLGLLLAAIAAIIVFVAISGAESGSGGGQVPVVVANQDIPANTRITNEMVKVEFFSADQADTQAFTSRSQVIDRVVTQEVTAGQAIVPTLVSDSAGDGIAFKVEPGTRAISVEVREVVTAGGNIQPGDRVDIVAIFKVKDVESANRIMETLGVDHQFAAAPDLFSALTQGEEEQQRDLVLTVTIFQHVKVLALAQSLVETSAGGDVADDPSKPDGDPRAATATLQLEPQQAQEITWADHFGVLRMEARAPGDDQIVDVVPTLFSIERTN